MPTATPAHAHTYNGSHNQSYAETHPTQRPRARPRAGACPRPNPQQRPRAHPHTRVIFVLYCVELMLAQVNSGCAVDRHSQRAAWCPGRLLSALMFLDTQQVLESRRMAS